MRATTTRLRTWAAVGGLCGLAWAASFRAYMAEITGSASTVGWVGTFLAILLPGAIVGVAFGASAAADPARHRRALRWAASAPLLFAAVPLALPGALVDFLTQGLGGGALGVALAAVAAGYAIGGGRRTWARWACGVLAGLLLVGLAATVPGIGGVTLGLATPRGAWVAVLAVSLVGVLYLAAAIPFRALDAPRRAARAEDVHAEAP